MPSGQDPKNGTTAEPRRISKRYRLTDPLGSGAMGTVWAGYDEVLFRPVAVKELRVPWGPPDLVNVVRQRMNREARVVGRLSHPNVVQLYDLVDVPGHIYLVMELLPSRNLGKVIEEQGRLSVSQAASVGLAIASALQVAHHASITHRDVRPGNVLVAHDGQIKVTNFGMDDLHRHFLTMTPVMRFRGSPAYMAPEVAIGERATPLADLWGLGATLFASVEGHPPYEVGGDPLQTVTALVHDTVPKPTISGPLAEVISALMLKEPDQRLALTEVRHRLRPLLEYLHDPR